MVCTWKKGWLGLMAAGLLSLTMGRFAVAADSGRASVGHARASGGFLAGLDRTVGLTPEQRDAVRGLLAQQRQASQAAREQTDVKIRAVLTPDQQKKFDSYLAQQKNNRGWKPAAN